jgi:hypothetical protein
MREFIQFLHDNDVPAMFTGLSALIAAFISMLNFRRLGAVHVQLNGQLAKLLSGSHAEGVVQERADQDARDVVEAARTPFVRK